MAWELEEAIGYYRKQGAPGDQSALTALLREIQQESGGKIPMSAPAVVADGLGVKESFVLALIRRIPSLRLGDTHCLELCAGPNCGKRKELAEFVEKTYGRNPGDFALKYVPCMRMCGKGPNIRWDGKVYQVADADLICTLVEAVQKK